MRTRPSNEITLMRVVPSTARCFVELAVAHFGSLREAESLRSILLAISNRKGVGSRQVCALNVSAAQEEEAAGHDCVAQRCSAQKERCATRQHS